MKKLFITSSLVGLAVSCFATGGTIGGGGIVIAGTNGVTPGQVTNIALGVVQSYASTVNSNAYGTNFYGWLQSNNGNATNLTVWGTNAVAGVGPQELTVNGRVVALAYEGKVDSTNIIGTLTNNTTGNASTASVATRLITDSVNTNITVYPTNLVGGDFTGLPALDVVGNFKATRAKILSLTNNYQEVWNVGGGPDMIGLFDPDVRGLNWGYSSYNTNWPFNVDFYGNVKCFSVTTPNSVIANDIYGNISLATNAAGITPVFPDDTSTFDVGVIYAQGVFAGSQSGNDFDPLSNFTGVRGGYLGFYIEDSSLAYLTSDYAGASFIYASVVTNLDIASSYGSFIACNITNNDNISIRANNGSFVAGNIPANTTNDLLGQFYYYGNGTFTGTNTAARFVGNGGGLTNLLMNDVVRSICPFEVLTNYAITSTTYDFYRTCGTNITVTLPDCTQVPTGWQVTLSSDNGNANFTVTNATGAQPIRDGSSLAFKVIGVDVFTVVNTGTAWYCTTRSRVVWPNAQFSCSTNIAMTTSARAISFNSTDFNNSQGIALLAGTNAIWGTTTIAITNSGQYEFSPSVLESFDGNNTITYWFKQGAYGALTNIVNSATPAKGQNGSSRVITVPFIVTVPAGGMFFEIWAICDDVTGNTLQAYSAGGSPPDDFPAAPSIICPVKRISDTRP